MQRESGNTTRLVSRLGGVAALSAMTVWSCGAYDSAPPAPDWGGWSGHVAAALPDGQAGGGGVGAGSPLDDGGLAPEECPWPVAADLASDAGPSCSGVTTCDGVCSAPDGGVVTNLAGPCGQEQVSCGALAPLEDALFRLATCCHATSEFFLDISFEQGCATSVALLPPYNAWALATSECIAKALDGKSIACAPTLGCVHFQISTLK